jgi:hypothetical protein
VLIVEEKEYVIQIPLGLPRECGCVRYSEWKTSNVLHHIFSLADIEVIPVNSVCGALSPGQKKIDCAMKVENQTPYAAVWLNMPEPQQPRRCS